MASQVHVWAMTAAFFPGGPLKTVEDIPLRNVCLEHYEAFKTQARSSKLRLGGIIVLHHYLKETNREQVDLFDVVADLLGRFDLKVKYEQSKHRQFWNFAERQLKNLKAWWKDGKQDKARELVNKRLDEVKIGQASCKTSLVIPLAQHLGGAWTEKVEIANGRPRVCCSHPPCFAVQSHQATQ